MESNYIFVNDNTNNTTVAPNNEIKPDLCNGKQYNYMIEGIFGEFQDSFLYTFVIQFIIVTLMYANVGRGKYWRLLFIASVAGLLGAIIEHGTLAFECYKSEGERSHKLYSLLLNEACWIVSEYSIPYLNLIKMKAFSKGRIATFVRYTIFVLTVPFVVFRLLIGYKRMETSTLNSPEIRSLHGYAFAVMAIADILCTFSILFFVKENNNQTSLKNCNINEYIKHSSYTILIAVDIVSFFLSISYIVINNTIKDEFENEIYNKFITPFHCLKNSFILILAADALIFKYGVNVDSTSNSTMNNNNNSRSLTVNGVIGDDSEIFKSRISNFSSSDNININNSNNNLNLSMSSNTNNNNRSLNRNHNRNSQRVSLTTQYPYPVFETDIINANKPPQDFGASSAAGASSSVTSSPTQRRSVLFKNFQNIRTPSILYETSPDIKPHDNARLSQIFGYPNQ
ncbi:hypothetical protein BCR32DRAFT_329262 [Anaeromyces robustus]|jgi:hypothetical protein|uniref:Uncharacterized protein n=1 Tax=Anaeromyces robustus TaxID=1754192 RepID=A0A1Y1WSX8_9FUNG|nr:hypothetical protein BCR32DRAFT_329262 [Anaeromyces robustus]|eukprot:ORX76650.1 hypothetical protein BCR32DRAFT_329262 [Anaeromyces robustus]